MKPLLMVFTAAERGDRIPNTVCQIRTRIVLFACLCVTREGGVVTGLLENCSLLLISVKSIWVLV